MQDQLYNFKISSDWLATVTESAGQVVLATASFADKRMRVYQLNVEARQHELLSTLGGGELLKIDPTLVKLGERWLLAYTTVTGAVNNGDPKAENGIYEVELFISQDLVTWQKISTIIKRKANIEDTRLFFQQDRQELSFIFEQEQYNLGPSSLRMLRSLDMGESWHNEEIIVDDGSDNEPAGALLANGSLYIFFSSDRDHPGQSYAGGNAFYIGRPHQAAHWSGHKRIPIGERLLLMDELVDQDASAYFVAVQDFNTTKTLMISATKAFTY